MYDGEENQRRIRNSVARSQSGESCQEVRLRKLVENRRKFFSYISKLFFTVFSGGFSNIIFCPFYVVKCVCHIIYLSVQEPAEHVHFLDDNEKVIERNGDVGGNGNGNGYKSLQPQHSYPNTHTTNPETSTTTPIKDNNDTKNIKNIEIVKNQESDPRSGTPGRTPKRPQKNALGSEGAPSCLSLLHKLCVGPATVKKLGDGGVGDGESDGEVMSVRGSSSSKSGGGGTGGVRTGIRGEGGGGGGGRGGESNTGIRIGTVAGTVGEGLDQGVCANDSHIEGKYENNKNSDKGSEGQGKEHEEGQGKGGQDEELKDEFLPTNSTSSETIEISFSSSAMKLEFSDDSDKMTDIKSLSLNLPENHDNSPNSEATTPIRIPDCDLTQKIGFIKQLEFIHKLTDIVDKLRSVDRALRGEILCRGLKKLNEKPSELGANSEFLLIFLSLSFCFEGWSVIIDCVLLLLLKVSY